MIERFADPERGGFFSTAADHEQLIARRKELEDAPIPSGASSAALGLLRLAALTGEARYEEAALGVRGCSARDRAAHPPFGHLLQALDFHLAPTREVAIAARSTSALRASCASGRAQPRARRRRRRDDDGVPLLEGRTAATAGRRPTSASASPAGARHRAGGAARTFSDRNRERHTDAVEVRGWRRCSPCPPVAGPSGLCALIWFAAIFVIFGTNVPGKFSDAENNESSSYLPGDAESTKTLNAVEDLTEASRPAS